MNIDENTAVETTPVSEQSADVQAQESTTNALDEFMADTVETTEDAQEENETAEDESEQTTEQVTEEIPKGIKGRILKAEEKADKRGYDRAQNEWAAQKAEYERKIAAYEAEKAEAEIKREAVALSKKEHVSVEFAERLLRAERGISAPVKQTSEKGTEPSKTENAMPVLSDQRRTQLNSQIEQIKKRYNMDVMQFVTDDDAKAIFDGSMELWEVALRAGKGTAKAETKSAPPTPVKSGGSSTNAKGGMDFATMTDEEFDRFNAKIARGAVYRPR